MGVNMRMNHALLVAGLFGLVAAHPARSADVVAVAADTLEEITVTAERREESAQKTPISMNVYTADEITRERIIDMQSLTETDPNLIFNRNGGEATLAIRGVTTTNTTELGNPAVPVGTDNFFVNRSASLDSVLFDIERIEVLLGPQGTLFGRSSIGGLVNITTAKPTTNLEASGSVEFGNYNAINATGMVNLPINDWLQLRVAASSRNHGGYRINTYTLDGVPPDRADDEDSHAARVSLAFEPFTDFKGLLSYQQEYQGGVGVGIQAIPYVFLPNGDISHEKPDLGDPNAWPMYGMPWQRITDKVTKWDFSYSGIPGGVTATYRGGYDNYSWNHSTSSISFFGFLAPPDNIFLPLRPYIQAEAPRTQNHELQFTSAATGFFTWVGGLYYFKETNHLNSAGIENPGTPDATTLLQFIYDVNTQSKAAYAQGALHFTDTTALSLGARYSKDDITRSGTFALPIFGIPPGPNGDGSYSSSKVTGHVGYDWNWTSTNLLYAKLDTGYKPGGFDSCSEFQAETVTTGEVGSKNRWSGNSMQWNAAVFYSDYKNQQVTQFIASCATGSTTTNAGKSKIYGLETDFKAIAGEIGTFDLGLSLLHATYDTLSLPPNNGTPGLQSCGTKVDTLGNCILDGNTMIQSPKVVVSAGFDHIWNLQSGAIDFRVEGRYTSKIFYDPFNYADTTQDGYSLLNSFVTYRRATWSVGMYGRNLTNKAYLNYAQEQSTGGATQYNYSYGSPRVYGVRFEALVK